MYLQQLYMSSIENLLKTKAELPLAQKTVLNISYSSASMRESMTQVLKPFDISIEQFNVLRILRGQNLKPTNLQDIQDRMLSKMSNTTRLVDKLIAKGFVERFICESNRRKVDIFITDSGLKQLEIVDPLVLKNESEMTQNLNKEELESLNFLLTKMRSSRNPEV